MEDDWGQPYFGKAPYVDWYWRWSLKSLFQVFPAWILIHSLWFETRASPPNMTILVRDVMIFCLFFIDARYIQTHVSRRITYQCQFILSKQVISCRITYLSYYQCHIYSIAIPTRGASGLSLGKAMDDPLDEDMPGDSGPSVDRVKAGEMVGCHGLPGDHIGISWVSPLKCHGFQTPKYVQYQFWQESGWMEPLFRISPRVAVAEAVAKAVAKGKNRERPKEEVKEEEPLGLAHVKAQKISIEKILTYLEDYPTQ